MDRSSWDRIVSAAGAVVAAVLIVLGTMAIYAGDFGRDNVRDRLVPQHIAFPPADAMTPEEKASVAARAEGLDPDVAAELQAKADTLFKGESLRAMLLNAYGWWTVATIALWAGFAMVIAGLILGIFSILGFWHAGRAEARSVERRVTTPEYVGASS
jgi:uncharacterized membrane protein YedE/YeeE